METKRRSFRPKGWRIKLWPNWELISPKGADGSLCVWLIRSVSTWDCVKQPWMLVNTRIKWTLSATAKQSEWPPNWRYCKMLSSKLVGAQVLTSLVFIGNLRYPLWIGIGDRLQCWTKIDSRQKLCRLCWIFPICLWNWKVWKILPMHVNLCLLINVSFQDATRSRTPRRWERIMVNWFICCRTLNFLTFKNWHNSTLFRRWRQFIIR